MAFVAPDTRLSQRFLLAVRLVLALTWLYQGLWLKLILVDPHHLSIVEGIFPGHGKLFLTVIGSGETLLGLGIASGLLYRFVTAFQAGLLITMNTIGILSGGVPAPAGLIVANLPLLMLMLILWRCGPGSWRSE